MTTFHRREFLIAGAAISSLASRHLQAAESPSFTFAVITDTHLGRRGSRTPAKLMKQAVEKVNASKAAFTLFPGDLVDSAHTVENQKYYAEWLEIAGALKQDWHAVPGNHDPRDVFKRELKREHDWEFEHGGVRFIGIADAGDGSDHLGHISAAQQQWLKERIADAGKKGQRVVITAHVTTHPNKAPDVGWWVKEDEKPVLGMLEESPNVAAVVSGHAHCGLRGWSDRAGGVQEIIFPALVYNTMRGLENTTNGYFVSTSQAVTFVDVFADRFELMQDPVDDKSPVFRQTLKMRKA